jgi:hypothetical protein
MNRFGPEVERSIRAAKQCGAKVSVFDDDGHLLWFCDNWQTDVGKLEQWNVALGLGWLEFVHHDDLPNVQKWIRATKCATIKMRTHSGKPEGGWVAVVMTKKRVGRYWLAVGDRKPITSEIDWASYAPWGVISAAAALGSALSHGEIGLGLSLSRTQCMFGGPGPLST